MAHSLGWNAQAWKIVLLSLKNHKGGSIRGNRKGLHSHSKWTGSIKKRRFIPESEKEKFPAQPFKSKNVNWVFLPIRRRKQIHNQHLWSPGGSSTYLLTILAQLYLGGEQREGAGRFPSGWFTGWCLEGRATDGHTEKERELIRQQGGRGRNGNWL